jgi:hypothetical protein
MARKPFNQGVQPEQKDYNAVLREQQVAELRLKGLEFAEIAQQTGYKDKSGAYYAWKRYLKKLPAEETEEQRVEVRQRLNVAVASIWDKVKSGDMWAIDRMVAIERLRMELLGLAKPVEDKQNTNTIVIREVPLGLLPAEALNGTHHN